MKAIALKVLVILAMLLSVSSLGYAAAVKTKTINVTATVPSINDGLNVTVSKVRVSDGVWVDSSSSLPIDFGTLTLDNTWFVFRPAYYYAVDVGVVDNSGTVWTVTHTRSSIQKDAANNLDNNVNVSFMNQLTASTDALLQKVSFANSNNVGYTKTQLGSGWLRIYYGIGTGKASDDASGVLPIGMDKPAGTYGGTVTLTLTP